MFSRFEVIQRGFVKPYGLNVLFRVRLEAFEAVNIFSGDQPCQLEDSLTTEIKYSEILDFVELAPLNGRKDFCCVLCLYDMIS
jgi:hypothetical protein